MNFFTSSVIVTLALFLTTVQAALSPAGFRQIGNTITGQFPSDIQGFDASSFNLGTVVELSDDGKRMAVGAQNDFGGAVFLYEREETSNAESVTDANWRLIWELHGNPGENLGERLSLSKDGQTIAVRRSDSVEVYHYDYLWQRDSLLGSPVTTCDEPGGKAVKLGETASSTSPFDKVRWLMVSCETFDNFRGKVDVLRFDKDTSTWLLFSSMRGSQEGSRFGWSTSFFPREDHLPRIAVSSPNYDSKRGMVQVFSIGESGWPVQLGSELLGAAEGDQFGFSMEVNTSGDTTVVAGAPQCNGGGVARGCVQVYSWSRPTKFSRPDWYMEGETLQGTHDNDRFGRSVAISSSGDRVAASSFHFYRQSGLVRLYERTAPYQFEKFSEITGDSPLSRWGLSVSLNKFGSMIASGAILSKNSNGQIVGSVQAFLDATPFCSTPLEESTEGLFQMRDVCRDGDGNLLSTPTECSVAYSRSHGQSCVWVDKLATSSPSSAPSVMPSSSPSIAPTAAPTTSPSFSPSIAPTSTTDLSPSIDQEQTSNTPNLRKGKGGKFGTRQWTIVIGASSTAVLLLVAMGFARWNGKKKAPEHEPAE